MFQSLAYRMIGAAAIITWGAFACCVMFGTLKFFGQFRVSEEEERKGKLFQKLTSFVSSFWVCIKVTNK
jgi:ammonia channel protein AmtB